MDNDPGFLSRIFDFGWALLPHWWLLATGFIFAVEPMIEALVPTKWRGAVNRHWSKETRHLHFRWASLLAVLVASFLAFDDVSNRNRTLQSSVTTVTGERDEARRQRDRNVSPAIDRLSGDLTFARGQIDAQKDQIADQTKRLDEQSQKIARLEAPKPARHLIDAQKQLLIKHLTPFAEAIGGITVTSPIGDGNAYAYADEFLALFKQIANLKTERGPGVLATSPVIPGPDVHILIKDFNHTPAKAELLAKALVASGIPIRGGTLNTLGDDDFMLMVGPAP